MAVVLDVGNGPAVLAPGWTAAAGCRWRGSGLEW